MRSKWSAFVITSQVFEKVNRSELLLKLLHLVQLMPFMDIRNESQRVSIFNLSLFLQMFLCLNRLLCALFNGFLANFF